MDQTIVTETDSLVAFWDFSEGAGQARVSAVGGYALQEVDGPIHRVSGGPFGFAASLNQQKYFSIPRNQVTGTALDISGPGAQVSVVAWIKRGRKSANANQLEFLGGLWNEDGLRQYGMFLNDNNSGKLTGHISDVGVGTAPSEFNRTRAKGATSIPFDEWITVGMTYDAEFIRVYYNGELDASSENPLKHPGGSFTGPGGIFDGGDAGSDFTFGAVNAKGGLPDFVIRNYFEGEVGGLAVFDRALTSDEMMLLHTGVVIPEPSCLAMIGVGAVVMMTRRFCTGKTT